MLFALLGVKSYAQGQFRKPLKSTNQSILGFSNYNVGVKLGCPWSYLEKTSLKETTYNGHFGYLAGFLVERNLGRWSVSIESTFAQKGTRMHNERDYQSGIGDYGKLKTEYSVAYNVATVRIPVTYYFKGVVKEDKLVPYIYLGPQVDLPLGFNLNLGSFKTDPVMEVTQKTEITVDNNNVTHENPLPEITKSFNPAINISAVAGIGVMTKIRFENSAIFLKLDAAYNRGIWNLAAPTKDGWKWPFENQENQIFAHDVEVNFSVVFPIKKILYDACHHLQ